MVTREAGKNAKLKQALQDRSISVLELPLVETSTGPDRHGLSDNDSGSHAAVGTYAAVVSCMQGSTSSSSAGCFV